jgi:ABC-type Fe3+-hydroxamate transport system substrate-binding protein
VEPEVLVDAVGTRHRPVAARPRIVSLVPSLTELLFDLDLGPEIVGRTQYCVHPREEVAAVPSVGGTKKVNLRKIRQLRPSHIILNIDENPEPLARAVSEFVPHVVITHPLEPADNLRLFGLFGAIFGRAERALRLGRDFEAAHRRLVDAARRFPSRKVVYLIWKAPWMTVSRDTYISRSLALARLATIPATADRRYPEIELDSGVLEEADWVLFSSEPYAFAEADLAEFHARYGVSRTRLRRIKGDLVSWYGSRAIAGLEYLRDFAATLDEP